MLLCQSPEIESPTKNKIKICELPLTQSKQHKRRYRNEPQSSKKSKKKLEQNNCRTVMELIFGVQGNQPDLPKKIKSKYI